MKKLSAVLLASTLAVSMVNPATVMAKENIFKEVAEKVEQDAKDLKNDVKAEAKKLEEKHLEKEIAKEEKKEAKEEKKLEKVEEKEGDLKIVVSTQKVTLDGKEAKIHGYNVNGSNYYKLRDLAAVLKDTEAKFAVDYKAPEKDQKTGEIVLEPGKEYKALSTDLQELKAETKGTVSNDVVKVGDKTLEVKAYKIGGHNYYNLRDLGKALKFGVNYDEKTRTVLLTSKEEKETLGEKAKEEIKKVEEKVDEAKDKLKKNGKEEAKEIEKQATQVDKQVPKEGQN